MGSRVLATAFSKTRGALQVQDRLPQLRLVSSECVCYWLRDATGLDCGDRSWICNAPQLTLRDRWSGSKTCVNC